MSLLPLKVKIKQKTQIAWDAWGDSYDERTLWQRGPDGFLASKWTIGQADEAKMCILPLDTKFYYVDVKDDNGDPLPIEVEIK